jgi:trehalose 2-sulfotransferase
MLLKNELFIPTISPNDHLKNVIDFFGEVAHAPANIPAAVKFVFICYTNRSGSNYLAELLASDQFLPRAGENLNSETIINHARQKSFKSFQEYFSFLVNHTKKNNFVTLKIAPVHLELLGKSGILDQIIDRSQFVVIERSDKLAQAISHLIAFQTGKFTSIMNGPSEKIEPKFNRDQLDRIITDIANSYYHFNVFFAHNGIAPAHVIYEQMAEDPVRTLSFVSSMIDTPELNVDPKRVRLERQTGRLNEEWRQQYMQSNVPELNTTASSR